MPVLSTVFSANAGVSVSIGEKTFYIDALHDEMVEGFSHLTKGLAEAFMQTAGRPDAILYTHAHPDHYSESLTSHAMEAFPDAKLLLPWQNLSVRGDNWSIRAIPLIHMGEYREFPNFGLLIQTEGKTVFASGDSDPSDSSVMESIRGLSPDFALLNFNWITLRTGRKALEALNPAHVEFIHLPYAEEDSRGYGDSARRCRDRFRPDAAVADAFLQKETFFI